MINEKNPLQETCAAMKRCNIQSAEAHIFRDVNLNYTNQALTPDNIIWQGQTIQNALHDIRARYREVTGQRLQPNAAPIREIVVTGLETRAAAERFKNDLENKYHIEVLSYAVHRDEGHRPILTQDWNPNLHAHFIVNIAFREHIFVMRTVHRNGHALRDVNGKLVKEKRDRYGLICHFTKQDLRDMQDLAAKATGLKRGTPSTKKHIDSRRYTVKKLEENIHLLVQIQRNYSEQSIQEVEYFADMARELGYHEIERALRVGAIHLSKAISCIRPEAIDELDDLNRNLQREIESAQRLFQSQSLELIRRLKAKAESLKRESNYQKVLSELNAAEKERNDRKEACRRFLEQYDTEQFDGMRECGLGEAIGFDIWDEVEGDIVEERTRGFGYSY